MTSIGHFGALPNYNTLGNTQADIKLGDSGPPRFITITTPLGVTVTVQNPAWEPPYSAGDFTKP